jgi:prepilin-type N-terminal cleavage/methylation domain-containing protein
MRSSALERSMRKFERHTRARRGFTLIETALATVIVGTGVLAVVTAYQAFHKQNRWASQAAIGQRLGNEIRELTLRFPKQDPVTGDAIWGPEEDEFDVVDYDDLDDFDGFVFSAEDGTGPINAMGELIEQMPGWSQTVSVQYIDPFEITQTVPDRLTDLVRVQVVVRFKETAQAEAEEVTRVSWIAPG